MKTPKQTGKTTIIIDKHLLAKIVGKRISKNKKIYYEYRKNRSDVDPKKMI